MYFDFIQDCLLNLSIVTFQWEDHAWKGQLKYDVTACEIEVLFLMLINSIDVFVLIVFQSYYKPQYMMPLQVIGGGKSFVTQLNENWNSDFLTEFEKNVLQPLESIKSSYMKTCKEDLLFCIAHGEKESSEIIFSTAVPKDGILVVVNVSN